MYYTHQPVSYTHLDVYKRQPQYGTVTLNGLDYYRTRVQDADGKLRALYARTPEELYDCLLYTSNLLLIKSDHTV